jgi:hypothetical protein
MVNQVSVTQARSYEGFRMLKKLLLASAFSVAAASLAMAEAAPDPNGMRGVHLLAVGDAKGFVRGEKTEYDWSNTGLEAPAERTTIQDMRSAFAGNEIAAERRFAKPFVVTGTLDSVARDSRGILVRFKEGGIADDQRKAFQGFGLGDSRYDPGAVLHGMTGGLMHGGAQAIVPDRDADAVVDWHPGQPVKLHCHGASNEALALLLDGCRPLAVVEADAARVADQQVDLFFGGKPVTVDLASHANPQATIYTEFVGFYATMALLVPSECMRDTNAMAKCFDAKRPIPKVSGDPKERIKQLIRDLHNPLIVLPKELQ